MSGTIGDARKRRELLLLDTGPVDLSEDPPVAPLRSEKEDRYAERTSPCFGPHYHAAGGKRRNGDPMPAGPCNNSTCSRAGRLTREEFIQGSAEVCKAAGYRVVKLEESALPQNSGYFLVTEEL